MAMPRFACTPVSPAVPRRSVLAALGALALLPSSALAEGELRIGDLVDARGLATERARAIAGRSLTLRGYLDLAPTGPASLILTDMPSGPCQLCGATHDILGGVLIEPTGPSPAIAALQIVAVTGELALGARGDLRLANARIRA
jgi:hypothetical protein